MAVVVTGANGFIGRNLSVRLAEIGWEVIGIGSDTGTAVLDEALSRAEFVFHLAGINRPTETAEFHTGNVEVTRRLCERLAATGRRIPLVYSSSIQAEINNPYGLSKRRAEEAIVDHARRTGSPVRIFRLANVFGKWGRPNYNSAVATFCHNIARGLKINVSDPAARLSLLYVDDAVSAFLSLLETPWEGAEFAQADPVHETTVGEVADMIRGFAASRSNLLTDRVGTGLTRALYSTYLSYLEPAAFAYEVPRHGDDRGVFVEMLKTPDCGQFSYFTAGPGITRGEHYHHTKTEKFLVLTGEARFGFRHIITNERFEIVIRGGDGRIVETIPGWTHDITNISDDEMVVMLWASEIFDSARPDTIAEKV